uniref:apolipoprotein N-acyltransferase n=1 Tax=Pararhizobium sp. IMCC3301 TaxID=3067904 RepID=UPI002740C0B2|nr:apolipoprotein N-acyltransferase [Pararhizobium sp. IMCC3301]
MLKSLLSLRGRRRAASVILLGAFAALAMAPVHFSPALLISFSGFCLILDSAVADQTICGTLGRKIRMAAWLGWCFGFGYFLAGLWWIGSAVLVDGWTFAWALPFAVAGIPAGLGLFWGLAAAGSVLLWRSNAEKILSLVVFFTLAEYLRGHILTGFPWNALGYAAMPTPLFMQSASVLGLWGVTLLTVLVASSPALFFLPVNGSRNWPSLAVLLVAAAALAGHTTFGFWRLAQPLPAGSDTAPVMLRLLQPNISQRDKWRQGNEEAVFQTHLDLSAAPGLDQIDALIWPESAFPFLVLQNSNALSRIDALLPKGVMLLAGAVRVRPLDSALSQLALASPAPPAPPDLKFYNSMIAFNDRAEPVGFYDKQRLVPFGEFMPFMDLLERFGIANLVTVPGGFASGTGSNLMDPGPAAASDPLDVALPPMRVLICYEAIFPGFSAADHDGFSDRDIRATGSGARSAQWIVNLTNDAWFGRLAGPYQHFQQARMRAVEEGLPLIRVANTGISAVVDGFGRVEQSLPLGTEGIIDTALPEVLADTFYSRFRDIPFALLMTLLSTILICGRIFGKPHSSK